jgi:hypothetical protein
MKKPETETDLVTFAEFQELCTEAGISCDNPETMEQDFRAGTALAWVTDHLITDQGDHPAPYERGEALGLMDAYISVLCEGGPPEGERSIAVKLAAQVIRYLAEVLYDEGKN